MTTDLLARPALYVPEIVDDVTRRDLLKGVGALGAGWVLNGCGSDRDPADTEATETAGFPRRVDHALGTTEIPAPPRRVISLVGQADLEWLLALGVTPVAYGQAPGNEWPFSYYQDPDALAGVEFLPWAESIPDLEAVAALQPDLLTGNQGRLEDAYDQLSQIAPTIAFDPSGGDLVTVGRPFAEALGRTSQLEVLVAERTAALDELRSSHADRISGVSMSLFTGEESFSLIFGPQSRQGGALVTQLGFEPAPALADLAMPAGEGRLELSLERLDALAADVMICLVSGPPQREFCDSLPRQPLLRDVPAVREGRLFSPPDGFPFFDLTGPLAYDAALAYIRDEVIPTLR